MTGYTRLFGSIVTSTIWCEPHSTRIVWITMLAMRNKNHIFEGSVPGLAAIARVTVDEARSAIEKLSAPDPDSRTKDFEGRRIQAVDGGWLILNGKKYQSRASQDERREYLRMKQQEFREVTKACGQPELTDLQWLDSLRTSPAYQGIDVDEQWAKMEAWCAVNGKQPSRRRFINWMNKAEKPMSVPPGFSRAAQRQNQTQNPIALGMLLKDQIQAKRDEMQRLRFKHGCGAYPQDFSWSANTPASVKEEHKKLLAEVRALENRRANIPV